MSASLLFSVIASGHARSTPTDETKPVQVSGNELETAIHLFESEAAAFAKSVITDPAVRADYIRKTKAASDELIQLVIHRKITPHEAAQTANAMRNQIMVLTRAKLSNFFLTPSRDIKRDGLPLEKCEAEYAIRRYGRAFRLLTEQERAIVWMDIVHAAGAANKTVSKSVRLYGIAGRTILIATLAFAVYNVATAENKPRQASKEGTVLLAGAAGGAAAGAAVIALASNPAGWVVGVAIFVSAALSGVGSSEVFDYFWPER
jgi:hypothetical protein